MIIRIYCFIVLMGMALFSDIAWSQSDRLSEKDVHSLSLDLSAGQFRRKILHVSNTATRFLSRTEYRPFTHISVSLLLGFTRLQLETNEEVFRDKYRLTYGVSFKIVPITVPGIGLASFISTHATRFVAHPAVQSETSIAGSALIEKRIFRYDWMEINLDLGLKKRFKGMYFTTGINVQFIHRKEMFTDELLFNGTTTSTDRQSGIFDSGAHVRPFMSLQVHLPQRLYIVVEAIPHNSDDFMIMLGLGQTGSP